MSSTDKFEKFRVMAARWRSLISDSNTPEVNAALNDSADFMDKLIAQKEAEQDERRKSDMENLTSAIQGLKEVRKSKPPHLKKASRRYRGISTANTVMCFYPMRNIQG